jgi:phosphatidylinositol alpha-mannosyltransferase
MTKNTQPLKIGFVLDDGLDRPDGVQQNILTLGAWLTSQGHEVHYLVGQTKRTDIKNMHSMARNVRVRFNGNKLTIPTYAPIKNIRRILGDENFDVLHVQMPYHPFCGARIVAAAGVKTVIVGTFHILEFNHATKLGARMLGMYLHNNLKKFDKFFSVSKPARDFAASSFIIESSILPNPVDVAKFKPKVTFERSNNSTQIVFVGRLVPRKGCMKLLEATRVLVADGAIKRSFHIDICGDGQLGSELKTYATKHGLKDFVTFHGFVSEEKKVSLLQQADIAVFPSSGGESFGIVLIEAMAAEAGVVLAGDNPGYKSVLDTLPGCLFDPYDAKQLARTLALYANNASKSQTMHTEQQKLVANFDVKNVGTKLVSIYRDCIERKKD